MADFLYIFLKSVVTQLSGAMTLAESMKLLSRARKPWFGKDRLVEIFTVKYIEIAEMMMMEIIPNAGIPNKIHVDRIRI